LGLFWGGSPGFGCRVSGSLARVMRTCVGVHMCARATREMGSIHLTHVEEDGRKIRQSGVIGVSRKAPRSGRSGTAIPAHWGTDRATGHIGRLMAVAWRSAALGAGRPVEVVRVRCMRLSPSYRCKHPWDGHTSVTRVDGACCRSPCNRQVRHAVPCRCQVRSDTHVRTSRSARTVR
jgi:hypothetical protein